MKQKDLISVIVPIYKVEAYLEKCINSILSQTYDNIEVILVDDGSPDNCPKICDEYAKKDTRIKVIHKQNGGLSDARNVGISVASGKYISFIDSDDYINKYFLEILYTNLINTKSDISICNYQKVSIKDIIDLNKEFYSTNISSFEGVDKFTQLFNEYQVTFVVAWNKLYKAEIFKENNIRYPFGKIHEDEFVIHHLLNVANKICFCDLPLYNYVIRDGSIMSQKFSEKNTYVFDALIERIDFFKKYYPEFTILGLNQLLDRLYFSFYKFNKSSKKILRQKFKLIKKMFKQEIKNLSFKQKLKEIIFSYFRFVFAILHR